jgi:hypothetical protein
VLGSETKPPKPAGFGLTAQHGFVLALLGFVLVLRALELRLPGMTRPFWQDEIHHNEPVLASPTLQALRHNAMYLSMFQPLFDFWTRKVFWFPAFGVNERALRLPALVYGLVLVLCVFALFFTFLMRRIGSTWAALVAALATLWIVDNPVAIYNATEGRHYMLVTLASVLWFALLFLFDGKPRPLFAVVTLLFANTHFFALPLIAAGYLLQLLRELRAQKYAWIPFHLLVCVAVYACTAFINREPLVALLARPPGMVREHTSPSAMFSMPVLRNGLALWLEYARALAVPSVVGAWTWPAWAFIGVAAFVRRRARWVPMLLVGLVGLPAFFTYVRLRSSYGFESRYFTPFFGLGIVTIAASLEVLLDEWSRVRARYTRVREPARWLGLGVMALLFGAPAFAFHLFGDLGTLRRIPKDFSPAYFASREVVDDGRPTLILHEHCWADDMQAIYYQHLLPPSRAPINWVDLRGCPASPTEIKQRVQRFLDETSSAGVVVIDRKEADCSGQPLPLVPAPLSLERFRSVTSCVWKLHGAQTRAQLADVASALGLEAASSLR